MDIRDKIITGSFAIGSDGRKEPIDWKDYSLKLEKELTEKDNLIKVLDETITKQWQFIEDVKKGQQGELKGQFITRIMKRANELIVTKK